MTTLIDGIDISSLLRARDTPETHFCEFPV